MGDANEQTVCCSLNCFFIKQSIFRMWWLSLNFIVNLHNKKKHSAHNTKTTNKQNKPTRSSTINWENKKNSMLHPVFTPYFLNMTFNMCPSKWCAIYMQFYSNMTRGSRGGGMGGLKNSSFKATVLNFGSERIYTVDFKPVLTQLYLDYEKMFFRIF